jgi:hypothetical protein
MKSCSLPRRRSRQDRFCFRESQHRSTITWTLCYSSVRHMRGTDECDIARRKHRVLIQRRVFW